MNSTEHADDKAHDDQLMERALAIASRFPEVHDISDCLQTVKLVAGLFATIIDPAHQDEASSEDFVPSPEEAFPRYSVVDAERISKKLRALAKYRGITPVLSTLELIERLNPELRALLEVGYSYDEINETLTDAGVDLRSLARSLFRRR
jgi:hypothetical protein